MQGIFDAIQMIDNIQTNNNLHIHGVMIYNSVSKKGRGSVYVRTSFNFVSNVGFYPENEYISYPLDVDSDIRGNKTNEAGREKIHRGRGCAAFRCYSGEDHNEKNRQKDPENNGG